MTDRYLQLDPKWLPRLVEKKANLYVLNNILDNLPYGSMEVEVNLRETALMAHTNMAGLRYVLMQFEGLGVLKVDRQKSHNPVYLCKVNPNIMFYGSEEELKVALEEWKKESV